MSDKVSLIFLKNNARSFTYKSINNIYYTIPTDSEKILAVHSETKNTHGHLKYSYFSKPGPWVDKNFRYSICTNVLGPS